MSSLKQIQAQIILSFGTSEKQNRYAAENKSECQLTPSTFL